MSTGAIHSINVSDGGVPKRPRGPAYIGVGGCEGDRQQNLVHHGGPDRAVCIFSLDLIDDLRAEGHPIEPGAIGENLTLAGIDWSAIGPGVLLRIGDVTLEVTKATSPCRKIAGAFLDGDSSRVSQEVYPGWSRWCCRVLSEGTVAPGDAVIVEPRRQSALF
jgi:MOSC domain-containing protein YiiM